MRSGKGIPSQPSRAFGTLSIWDDSQQADAIRSHTDWRSDEDVARAARRIGNRWRFVTAVSAAVLASTCYLVIQAGLAGSAAGQVPPAQTSTGPAAAVAGVDRIVADSNGSDAGVSGATSPSPAFVDGRDEVFPWVYGEDPGLTVLGGTPRAGFSQAPLPEGQSLGPAVPIDASRVLRPRVGAEPVGIRIADIDVVANVHAVGLEEDGSMEIPSDILDVGWYDLGPKPGEQGSAVLAGHVDGFPNLAGAFYALTDIEIGSRIVVDFDDGSSAEFEAVGVEVYDKAELPIDELFRVTGPTTLVLITCGGTFDETERSYQHNLVVIAEPID